MGFNVLEKMQNLDTWDDIVKVSDPFLEYMSEKFYNADFSFLDEFDDLKKVVDRLQAELNKVIEEHRPARDAFAAVVDEMTELYKMIDDRDKFKNLLESETAFNYIEKHTIWVEWGKHRFHSTKVGAKCLVCSKEVVKCCSGSEAIEECLKRKSVEVSEARPKAQLLEPRMVLIGQSLWRATEVKQMIQSYIDKWGFSPPPYLSSPPASPYPSPPASPTNKRVGDNIGSSSSPSKEEG